MIMDKTIETKIRELAGEYVLTSVRSNDIYNSAAQHGIITHDDIFYLGVVNAVQSETLRDLVQRHQAPLAEEPTHRQMVVVQDDPAFRETISSVGYHLLAEMFHCTPKDAEEKFYRIQELVTKYHNQELEQKKD